MINALLKYRFAKFGVVGASGTLVNLGVLFLGQEFIFVCIQPEQTRIRVALLFAILVATFNNYLLNRWWTWSDRRKKTLGGFLEQMWKYYLSCSLSAAFQYVTTILLAKAMHYMQANIIAILLAAILTYLVNHAWTFGSHKKHTP